MNKELKIFLLTFPLALGTLLIPSLLGDRPLVVVTLLFIISVLMLAIDWNKRTLLLYFLVFASGPLAESVAIYFGAWDYTRPVFLGIPLWLPFVWGNSSLYIIRLKAVIDLLLR